MSDFTKRKEEFIRVKMNEPEIVNTFLHLHYILRESAEESTSNTKERQSLINGVIKELSKKYW